MMSDVFDKNDESAANFFWHFLLSSPQNEFSTTQTNDKPTFHCFKIEYKRIK